MTPIVSNPVTEKHTSAAKGNKNAEEPITKLEIDKSRRKINFDEIDEIEPEMENGAQNEQEQQIPADLENLLDQAPPEDDEIFFA